MYLTQSDDFDRLRSVATAVADLGSRLPDMVFAKQPRRVVFLEDVVARDAATWPLLREALRGSGDPQLLGLVVSPDPDLEYRRQYGCYGALVLAAPDATEYERLWTVGPPQFEHVAALEFAGKVVLLMDRSGGWALWYDRGNEIAAMADFDGRIDWNHEDVAALPLLDLEAAIGAMAVTHLGQVMPPSREARFRMAYAHLVG